MQIQSIRNPSEASLAPHAHQSLDAYLQNRGAVRFMNARDGIFQFAVIIGQIIPQTLKAGN
jgi:hypothetical protein